MFGRVLKSTCHGVPHPMMLALMAFETSKMHTVELHRPAQHAGVSEPDEFSDAENADRRCVSQHQDGHAPITWYVYAEIRLVLATTWCFDREWDCFATHDHLLMVL